MVIKVYVSMISCSQEVKKNQQRTIMILESKNIAFTTLDITDPGQEDSKDYMNENARPKGDNKVPMTPQIFNEADYCGDFDDLDMANETDSLGEFLKLTEEEKKGMKIGITGILPEERARAEKEKKDGLTNGVSAGRETENVKVANDVDAAEITTGENPVEAMGESIETFENKVNEETTEEDGGNFFGSTEEAEEEKKETAEDTPATEEEERQTKGEEIEGKKGEGDAVETHMKDEAEA